jgi:Na+/H+ antiporter NhaD/arsenite permease-like protein
MKIFGVSPIHQYIALSILILVFFLIIERSRLNNIPIWTSMLIGAALMIGLQVISIEDDMTV